MAIELLFQSNVPYKRQGNELIYKECPLCGNQKFNVQINIAKGVWHCWACDRGGRLRGLSVLASEFGITVEEDTRPENEVVVLPETAKPIWLSQTGSEYLELRGVTGEEARRLNILYDYGNLYVPYFEGRELVAFSVRTKEGKWIFNGANRDSIHYLIRGKTDTLVFTEGLFDGIKASRTGHNVFVLFGRVLYKKQLERLVQIFNKFILALDNDKPGIMATLKIAKQLDDAEIRLHLAKAPEGKKDFGECSTEEVLDAFQNAKKLGISELLRMRMFK